MAEDKKPTIVDENTKSLQVVASTKVGEVLRTTHAQTLINHYGSEVKAAAFVSSVQNIIKSNPKLAACTVQSQGNAILQMASLKFYPSEIMAEASFIPYGNEMKFQIQYQGWITLLSRAGVSGLQAEIVRENDKFSIRNGVVDHEIDYRMSESERGEEIGAYAEAYFGGRKQSKYMNGKDIIAYAKKFSKSFTKKDSPWNKENDPELWMWKKTAIIQLAKLLPKNDNNGAAQYIKKAIEMEYQEDSRMYDAIRESDKLRMGNNVEEDVIDIASED